MGHIRNGHGIRGRLEKRLDRFPIGAPPAEALYEILKGLFTEEEAEIGRRMPIRSTDLAGIARRMEFVDITGDLEARLSETGIREGLCLMKAN